MSLDIEATNDYNEGMNKELELESPTLTALDRCDQGCGAAAKVICKGMEGELIFCGHHYTKFRERLSSWHYEVVDERHVLPPKTTHTS